MPPQQVPDEWDPTPLVPPAPCSKVTADDFKDVQLEPSKISSIQVLTDAFEGPLDLLWFLICKEKLNIFNISLARITEQYLQIMNLMQTLDLDLAGEYLLVASQLLAYKSRSLLPTSMPPADEEPEPRPEDLEQRLQEYIVFKQIALELSKQYQLRQDQFPRPTISRVADTATTPALDLVDIDIFDLYAVFKKILEEIGEIQPVVLSDEDFTVEEKIEELRQLLLASPGVRANLTAHLRSLKNKLEVIVTFLALLEIIRLKLVRVQQLRTSMDIFLVAVVAPDAWMEEHEREDG